MIGMNLVIALLILTLLYVLQLYFSKSILVKLVLITYMFVLSSLVYFSFETYKGWPTIQAAKTGYIVSVYMEEPTSESKGGIYFWVVDDTANKLTLWQKLTHYQFYPQPAPRAYYLPHTDKNAKLFSEVKKQLDQGMIVQIDGTETTSNGQGDESNTDSSINKDGNGGDVENYAVPHLQIILPQQLLRKSLEQ
jgi:hypothetical protein